MLKKRFIHKLAMVMHERFTTIISTQEYHIIGLEKVTTSVLWVQSRLGYNNKNHDTHLSCVMSPKLRTYQNECSKMLNNERGICMFRLSTNKCYNEWFKSIEEILNVLFKYKPKRNARLLTQFRMTNFHLECQNLKKNQIMSFLKTFGMY